MTIAWLQTARKKNPNQPISILLFSYPKHCLVKRLENAKLTNVDIKDYFTIKTNSDAADVSTEITQFAHQNPNSILVVNCINTLALQIGAASALRFAEKLQQNHKAHTFFIYRRDFCTRIPRIETLSGTYVSVTKSNKNKPASDSDLRYQVAITLRKPGGSVVHSNELVSQNICSYTLKSEKITVSSHLSKTPVAKAAAEPQAKPEACFRIEMNEQEMKQRDSVPLPYILSSNSGSGESKIIYELDDEDDFDDPDDDLDI